MPSLRPSVHGGPQIDLAMEANLGAAGRGPRTEFDDEDYSPQGSWDTVFLVTLLLLGLPANGLMAWLAGSQARHGAGTRLALLLFSLALSDFLFLGAAAFQILEIQHGGHWPLGTAACRFYYFLWGVSYSSGLFLLAALSLDRCLLALCPRWYPGRRPARLPLWVSAAVWVLATLFSVPWLVFPEATVWWYDLVICLDFWDGEELPLRMLEVLGGFLPFLLLLVCHALTQAATCRTRCRPEPRPAARHGFARVARTILSAYVVLRLPYQLAQLLYLAFLWDVYPGYLLWEALVYSDYLILLNSCLSPFLCLLASADLRALLRTVLSSFAAAVCEERPGSFTPAKPRSPVAAEGVALPGPSDAGARPPASPTGRALSDPPAQPQVSPTDQPRSDPGAQTQADPTIQTRSDSAAQPLVNPTIQTRSDSAAQPLVNPTIQTRSDSAAQPLVNPTIQTRSDSAAQLLVNPTIQTRSDSAAQPLVNPTIQTRSDSAAQLLVNPTIQTRSDSAAQPQVNSTDQPPSDPVAQPQVNPIDQPPSDPVAQPQENPTIQTLSDPAVQPQVNPMDQPPSDPVAQPQENPTIQTLSDPVAQPQVNPMDQPPLDPAVHPQVNPMDQPPSDPAVQPQANPMDQPPSDPAAQPQVNPTDQPQSGPVAQAQLDAEAQTPASPASLAPSPSSPDPTPGPPENAATEAVPEAESPSSAPPAKAPGAGPT